MGKGFLSSAPKTRQFNQGASGYRHLAGAGSMTKFVVVSLQVWQMLSEYNDSSLIKLLFEYLPGWRFHILHR
jgi:hypothetical protein